MNVMDYQEIIGCLPHRPPFLFVDRVLETDQKTKLLAIKNVTIMESFFAGHFPMKPVMPGVLIIEALAQACGILAHIISNADEKGKKYIYYLASVDDARFRQVVVPGDQLFLDVTFLRRSKDASKFHGEAKVNGKVACSADIMCVRKEIQND